LLVAASLTGSCRPVKASVSLRQSKSPSIHPIQSPAVRDRLVRVSVYYGVMKSGSAVNRYYRLFTSGYTKSCSKPLLRCILTNPVVKVYYRV
jgi:hypothetical protein